MSPEPFCDLSPEERRGLDTLALHHALWPSLQNRRKRGLVLLLQTDGRPLPCPPITCSCSYLLWLFSFFPW